MGRRLNNSQAVVIQTELTPLSDMFSISASDTLEQWYYVNGGGYSPNRNTTPLILTPNITATDTDNNVTYHPNFSSLNWYYFDDANHTDYSASDDLWPGFGWVKISDTDPTHTNTYILGDNDTLIVKKNVPVPSVQDGGGQEVCCVAQYTDPRDGGVVYTVIDTVTLVSNLDATTDFIEVDIQAPALQTFNPIVRYNLTPSGDGVVRNDTQYTFLVKVISKIDNSDVTANYDITWYALNRDFGPETNISTLPCYTMAKQQTGKGQGTDTITIDAMYIEEVTLIARIAKNGTTLPPKDQVSLSWEFPKVDSMVECKNGDTVNSVSRKMTFGVIANTKDGVISEESKQEHFVISWKKQKSTDNYEDAVDLGYGQTKTVNSDLLKQTQTYATIVMAEIYMLGAYEQVTEDGSVVTENDEPVFDRY